MGNELCLKCYFSVETMYRIKFAPTVQPIVASCLGCLHPRFPCTNIKIRSAYSELGITIIMEIIGIIILINISHSKVYNEVHRYITSY
jgi:hypothetical protein